MWLNQTWAPYSSAKSRKVPKSGKDISYATTPDYFDVGPMATSNSRSGDMHEWPVPDNNQWSTFSNHFPCAKLAAKSELWLQGSSLLT